MVNKPDREISVNLEDVLDQLDLLAALIDEDFNILTINREIERLFGNVTGKKCFEVFHSANAPPDYCAILNLLKGGSGEEEFYEQSIGRWLKVRASRLNIGDSTVFLHLAEDVTERKKMEMDLIERERKFKSLFESAVDIIYLLSPEGKILDVNPAIKSIGYSKEEIIGKYVYDIFTPNSRKKFFDKLDNLMKEGFLRHEVEVVSKDGRIISMECVASIIRDNGDVSSIISIHRDITERKQMEEKLKESEEKYRTLVEKTHDAVYLLTPDGFLFVNDRVCDLTRYTKEELYRIDPLDLIHPDDRERIREYIRRRFSGEKAPESHISKIITKDGETRYCEFSVKAITYMGQTVILGSVRDITEKKLMEDKLRESEEKYRTLVETINDIVFALDTEGRFTYLNKKFDEITGYSSKDLIGKHFRLVLAPEYVDSTIEKFKRGLSGEKIPLYEVELIGKNGRRIFVELNVTNMKGRDGKVIGRLGVARDITERKKMEKKLVELNETLKLINKILRHDLLNDLTVISYALEMYKETGDEEIIDRAFKAIERGIKLIRKMRELEGLTNLSELRKISVRKVVEDVTEKYQEIEFKVSGDCVVFADEAFGSVIDNIVNNAIVHGKTDRIDITIKHNGFCEIRIADYGKGVPDEIKEKIFEEGFFSGDTGHTGLGLYIVKKVVERYDGEVWVEDNEPKGAVFVIKLKTADHKC